VAFYDDERAWIEMRLRARRPVRARVRAAGLTLSVPRSGEIRTEISCKYTLAALEARTLGTGLAVESWFTGPDRLFGLALMRPAIR
jgi:L-histidine N-alpha-methyltransferase